MHILLWRHAEAEEGSDDLQRRLTMRGQRQAKAMALWIRRNGPQDLRILVSPAVRAQQTAETLSRTFETVPAIAPTASASDLFAAIRWQRGGERDEAVMLVGHQPALGELAALLLSGSEAPWTIKKGALWWFTHRSRGGESQVVLQAVMSPDLVG